MMTRYDTVAGLVLGAHLICGGGCKKVEPAPEALDRLFPYFFTQIDEGTDEDLAYGIRELHRVMQVEDVEDVMDGSISTLNRTDLEVVGMGSKNPGDAAGVYLVKRFDCSLAQLEAILSHKNQDELYEGVYDRYSRTYTSSKDAYLSREAMDLTWDLEYDATIVGKSYTSQVKGKLRRVRDLGAEESPFGSFLVSRAYIPRPAQFESGSTRLDQDYQIEMYYSASGGEILHAYGVWREADFGGGIDSDSEGSQRLLLNSMADWDDDTERLCAEGRP